MKKLLALVLSLLLLFSAAAESTTAESVDALKAEIARLRAELETLQARLDLYRDPSVVAIFDGGFITFDELVAETDGEYDNFIAGGTTTDYVYISDYYAKGSTEYAKADDVLYVVVYAHMNDANDAED